MKKCKMIVVSLSVAMLLAACNQENIISTSTDKDSLDGFNTTLIEYEGCSFLLTENRGNSSNNYSHSLTLLDESCEIDK